MVKTDGYNDSQLFMGLSPVYGFKASKLYSYKPTNGNGDFVWSRNSTAFRVNQNGFMELMGANVPTIDHLNGCPELLIQKAATNYCLQSENFSTTWSAAAVTVTTNNIDAPDGNITADRLTAIATNETHFIGQAISVINASLYCFSCFFKKGTYDYVQICFPVGGVAGNPFRNFNLNTGTEGNGNLIGRITDYNNGWYRCDVYFTTNATTVSPCIVPLNTDTNSANPIFTGGGYIYAWGAQLEDGDYATSYIPTTTTTQTRPYDEVYNTALGYLDAAFSFVVRFRMQRGESLESEETILTISEDSGTKYIRMYTENSTGRVYVEFFDGVNREAINSSGYADNSILNIGFAYNNVNSGYILVINGTLITLGDLSTTAGEFGTLERVDLGGIVGAVAITDDRIIGVQYYDTNLTQTDLENLTS